MKNITIILVWLVCITPYSFSQTTAKKYSLTESQASVLVQRVFEEVEHKSTVLKNTKLK